MVQKWGAVLDGLLSSFGKKDLTYIQISLCLLNSVILYDLISSFLQMNYTCCCITFLIIINSL